MYYSSGKIYLYGNGLPKRHETSIWGGLQYEHNAVHSKSPPTNRPHNYTSHSSGMRCCWLKLYHPLFALYGIFLRVRTHPSCCTFQYIYKISIYANLLVHGAARMHFDELLWPTIAYTHTSPTADNENITITTSVEVHHRYTECTVRMFTASVLVLYHTVICISDTTFSMKYHFIQCLGRRARLAHQEGSRTFPL